VKPPAGPPKSVADDDRRRQTPATVTSLALYSMCRRASNNANRSRDSPRSTFSNCQVLFRYLHSLFTCIVALGTTIAQPPCNAVRVINRLTYDQLSTDCNCDQPTSTTTSVVDVTAYYSTNAPSWTPTTMADGNKGFKQQKLPSTSLKVPRNGNIRYATYDFLLVFSCNFLSIVHRFRDIITYFPKLE